MPIRFRKKLLHQELLDPNNNFEPALVPIEIRWDTLTGRTTLIQEFKFRGKLPKPDYSAMIEKTRPVCPFCPGTLEKVSPKFPPELVPEGRLNYRGTVVIPNVNPYASYSALAILAPVHFLELSEFSEEIIVNGMRACQEYLRKVASYDPAAKYISINWNYLPPSGGSVIHPHFQAVAAYVAPTYEKETLAASRRYFNRNRTIYWADLVKAEKERGERFIGETGNVSWLVNFAGRGREPDIISIFEKKHSILQLSESDFVDFYEGLRRVFKYMGDNNYISFNMVLYSAPPGREDFRVHTRLKLRFQFPLLSTADYCFMEALHDQFLCQTYPEAVAREVKTYFM